VAEKLAARIERLGARARIQRMDQTAWVIADRS
jgi:hypothetical protein